MPNTTNNNWPTPADTDLVKNGADAIRDLGNAIDTTLGVYSPVTPGLVKINTTSFNGVSTQTFNDVFSTTYDNYKIVIKGTNAGQVAASFRLRVSGTDASGANYTFQSIQADSTTVAGVKQSSVTSADFVNLASVMSNAETTLFSPFLAEETSYISNSAFNVSGARNYQFAGSHSLATSYTGITIIAASGTMTGTMSIYGFTK